MPRPWLVEIEGHPSYRSGFLYEGRVTDIYKIRTPRGIQADLEHTDETQSGRALTVVFPTPIRPAGVACQFFRACGFDVSAGNKLTPRDAVGRKVRFQLEPDINGNWHVVSFEPFAERSSHDTIE